MTSSAEAFPPEEYEQRRARVLAMMAERQLAVLVASAPEDVYYLSGLNNQGHFVFTALVLDSRRDTATLVAREMEAPTASVQSSCVFAGYRDGTDPADVVGDVAGSPVPERVGYQPESPSLPVGVWQGLDRRLGSPTWVDCTGLLADARAVRTEREIAHLREAGRLSDIGIQAGIEAASDKCTGGELVGAIQHAMLSAGSDYPGFVPLVRPLDQIRQEHVAWTAARIDAIESLFFELSAASARYHAPLARTVRPRACRDGDAAAELSRTALEAIVAALRPDRTAEDVYLDWQTTIETGLGHGYERHHCGYSVGIGFPPSWMAGRVDSLRPGNQMTLRPGMTFHIQSWVLDERLGTHAMSDTALVTAGGAELLTTTPRHPTRP